MLLISPQYDVDHCTGFFIPRHPQHVEVLKWIGLYMMTMALIKQGTIHNYAIVFLHTTHTTVR